MNNGIKTGIFLCGCSGVIENRIDLAALLGMLEETPGVADIQTHCQYCMNPGLTKIAETVKARGLNRVLLGACSDRIMKKKFAGALENLGLLESQIEMVNLRDLIALVDDRPKEELARKAAALLAGAVASLGVLEPCAPAKVAINGPALLLGGGISAFETARELACHNMESILFSESQTPEDVLDRLPRCYPGSRIHFDQLEMLLKEVFASPLITVAPEAPLEFLTGHLGNYRLGLSQPDGSIRDFTGSVLSFALDREFVPAEKIFTGGGARVLDQMEFEDRLAKGEVEPGRFLFWANGAGAGMSELSTLSAWRTCQYLVGKHPAIRPAILYPANTRFPLTAANLAWARHHAVGLHGYNPEVHPVIQSGILTYTNSRDHRDHEIPWDTLVVSALPGPPTAKTRELGRFVQIFPDDTGMKKPPLQVKPEQEPVKFPFLAGSALKACDLDEALQQGKRAARGILSLKEKSRNGGLASPLVVVSIDEDLCEGCGLCSELCTCGGVQGIQPAPGAIIRRIDPHTCDGGGSCAAACPYGAIKVLNNSTKQLEAKVRTVVSHMKPDDVLAFACSWGGQGAAELAAKRNLAYSARLFIIPVRCLGTIDPTILSMAFLKGANFILLAGCPPSASCHYGFGVDHTWFRVSLVKKLLGLCGLERERIALGYVDTAEPESFVKMVESFVSDADRLGPVDRTGNQQELLLALHSTLNRPRVRWVLGASLRRPSETEFPGDSINPVEFDETVQEVTEEEYLCARIVGALRASPLTPSRIAAALGEQPIKVTRLLGEMLKDKRVVCEHRQQHPFFALANYV